MIDYSSRFRSSALGMLFFTLLATKQGWAVEVEGVGIDVQDCAVRFAEEVEVPALGSGRVAEVLVTVNQQVDARAALARLDDRSLLIRRGSSQLRVELAQMEANDEIELRYAETALSEAEAELDTSRSIQNDVRGAVPLTQIRRLKLAVTRGELEVARAKKRRIEAQTALDVAQAEVAMIDDQLRNLHVESPLPGIVLEVHKRAGEWVETGETIATVARIDRLHLHAILDSKTLAPDACPGSPVSVQWAESSSGKTHSLRGRVISVDPQLMPGGRYRLHAEVVNESVSQPNGAQAWKLRPGAEVTMKVYASTSVARRAAATIK